MAEHDFERLCRIACTDRKAYLAAERELARRGERSQRQAAFFGRRKISRTIADAWFRGKPRTIDNSETDGETIWLFGHAIAWWDGPGEFTVTTAGHPSLTTRERLNALPGVSCYQSKGLVYLNGAEWDGGPTTIKLSL